MDLEAVDLMLQDLLLEFALFLTGLEFLFRSPIRDSGLMCSNDPLSNRFRH